MEKGENPPPKLWVALVGIVMIGIFVVSALVMLATTVMAGWWLFLQMKGVFFG